jgi:eukaryotic-like serine/threonine-protein kinase
MLTTQSLKDTALIFEEYGQWFPFSEAFGRFIRTKEHAYVGRPVNPGELLWKQYKVEAIAGRTLHSQVVKAQDTLLQQYWAVKLLCINQDHTNKQISEYQERLLREARILTSLKHKNIGQVHEVRLNPLGVIMPWVEGKSLLHWLEEEASLLPSVVIQIGYDLADALYYAHQKKITHRDIKPNNIILNTNAEPILIDFDVARSQNHNTITYNMQNGASLEVGNVEYGAPEQFAHPDLVGPPADIFALGAVLYRLLTHEQPYPYGNDARGYPDVLLPPLEQQEIPDALYSVLCVMLHQYPEERPGADEVCSKLKQCLIPLKS